jgi:hypothetical protein
VEILFSIARGLNPELLKKDCNGKPDLKGNAQKIDVIKKAPSFLEAIVIYAKTSLILFIASVNNSSLVA